MSILVDDRVGSKDMVETLCKLGLDASLGHLESGDIAFSGNGPTGPIAIGIERKRLMDMFQCMISNRLADIQIPEMAAQFDRSFLVVEGTYRPGEDGLLEVYYGGWKPAQIGSRRFMYTDFEAFMAAIADRTHLIIRHAGSKRETAFIVKSLFNYYSKPWGEHRSMEGMYKGNRPIMITKRASFLHRAASELPGVDWVIGGRIDAEFAGSMQSVCLATEEDLRRIDGIGKERASNIYKTLRGKV